MRQMRVRGWIALAVLLAFPAAHANETEAELDPDLEVIEMLGEAEVEEADLDIAMSNINAIADEESASPQEVKDDE
ncbi:MAG: hypothetical protein HZB47_14605 [Nitrosomonadales bacterium]|nr:hypothetical protein [Nitrosomonadales bacterium]